MTFRFPAKEYNRDSGVSRRSFLSGCTRFLSLAALGMGSGSSALLAGDTAPAGKRGSLDSIGKKNIFHIYRSRQLENLSDAELYRAAAAIISVPGKDWTSFTLHAPLELMARYGLLPLVGPRERTLARMQLTASAAFYQAGIEPVDRLPPMDGFADETSAAKVFSSAYTRRDMGEIDRIVQQIGRQFGLARTVQMLASPTLTTLQAASHAHIGLWLVLRHAMAGPYDQIDLLRMAARLVTEDPESRISAYGDVLNPTGKPLKMSPAEVDAFITRALQDPPRGDVPSGSIMSIMKAAEKSDIPEKLFGEILRHDWNEDQMDAAFRAVLRISALAMLQDDPDRAKFGWSHQLTLPQAACGLSVMGVDRKLCLAVVLAWGAAYRGARSRKALDPKWSPDKTKGSVMDALQHSKEAAAARVWHASNDELPGIMRTIAGQASIRNDQHLVKYVRACFDMIGFDPAAQKHYLAGAASLCSLWMAETPVESLEENLAAGRRTPI